MFLSKEAILSADDKIIEEVEVSEWGGTVRLKSLTGAQRDKYEAAIVDMKGKDPKIKLEDLKVRLLALCIVDEQGDRIFGDSKEDLQALGSKNAKIINRLFERCQSICGMTTKDVEELEKN